MYRPTPTYSTFGLLMFASISKRSGKEVTYLLDTLIYLAITITLIEGGLESNCIGGILYSAKWPYLLQCFMRCNNRGNRVAANAVSSIMRHYHTSGYNPVFMVHSLSLPGLLECS